MCNTSIRTPSKETSTERISYVIILFMVDKNKMRDKDDKNLDNNLYIICIICISVGPTTAAAYIEVHNEIPFTMLCH